MTSEYFLAKIQEYLTHNQPFVMYRKPAAPTDQVFAVSGYFQSNDKLYEAVNFTESGFVMAPFDIDQNQSILIPSNNSKKLSTKIDLSEFIIPDSSPKEIPNQSTARENHLELISKGMNVLNTGELHKVVLSRKIQTQTHNEPIEIFKRLLKSYPTAFVYCWFHPKKGLWMGATPESLLKVDNQELKTVALAGTKPVEKDLDPQWTSKEFVEQQFVTDFLKNNLKGKVTDLLVSEVKNVRAGNLWHLKTDISAKLNNKDNLKPILLAIHPTPAVCGEPKEDSKNFILKHENYNREFYSGFLGELNVRKQSTNEINQENNTAYQSSEIFVNLRCMQMQKSNCYLYVGGGITENSIPQSEWEETVNKSQTMLKVI